MKMFLLIASFLLAFAGVSYAASFDGEGVQKCLADGQTTMVVPEKLSDTSYECRLFLFAPQPQSWWSRQDAKNLLPKMPWPYGGNSMRAAALSCSGAHGNSVASATFRQMPTACRLHYFPVLGTDRLTVKVPDAEVGGLY